MKENTIYQKRKFKNGGFRNERKEFGDAEKFRSHLGKWLIQDRSQNFFREWVGFQKSYVIT